MRATPRMMAAQGARTTQRDHHDQKRDGPVGTRTMRSELMRGPKMPSSAGSSVRAAATQKTTTRAPATPMLRMAAKGKKTRPRMPTATARPLKKTERPARATVASTARPTVCRASSSSLKRATMNSA